MMPTAPQSTAVMGGLKTSDPRIMSPDIKVIYPSESEQKDLQVSEQQTTAPIAQVLPTSPLSEIEESTAVTSKTSTTETTSPETPSPKLPTWKETLKEHAGLFIAVALISVGIGVLIGKKM